MRSKKLEIGKWELGIVCFLLATIYYLLFTALVYAADPAEEEDFRLSGLVSAYPAEENINIGEYALLIARTIYPEINPRQYMQQLDQMADEIRKRLTRNPEPEQIIRAINGYLYQTKQAKAEPMDKAKALEKFMLNKVLDSMEGNCMGFSILYLALAERLDLTLTGVVIPQHVFLRYNDGKVKRNIETTSGGRIIKEDEYIKQTRERISDTIERYSIGEKIIFRELHKKEIVGLILFNRGVDYYKKGNLSKAHHDFTLAIKLDPKNYEAYKSRGAIYLQDEKFEQAADDFSRAIKLEDDCPANYLNLGTAYARLNNQTQALKYLNQAQKLAPDYTEVYQNRGIAYSLQKEWAKALKDFNQALELSPNHAPTYFNRGLVYYKMGASDKALKDFTMTIKLDSEYYEAYNIRGVIYAEEEKWGEAIDDFQKANSLAPDFPDAYRNLGVAYFKMERYKEAHQALTKFLRLVPESSPKHKEIKGMLKEIERRMK